MCRSLLRNADRSTRSFGTRLRRPAWGLFAVLALNMFQPAAQAQAQAPKISAPNIQQDDQSSRMAAILADKQRLAVATREGKKASVTCAFCHGPDGNSVSDLAPNLAGQNPAYLLEQIHKFADGRRRSSAFMERVVKVLNKDEIINISLYFAGNEVKPTAVSNATLATAGKLVFVTACQKCHQASALGDMATPRLAGQKVDYLTSSLTRYRSNTGERQDSQMQAVAARLSDDQIKAVSVYLASKT